MVLTWSLLERIRVVNEKENPNYVPYVSIRTLTNIATWHIELNFDADSNSPVVSGDIR